jgi:hypothetical protein
MLAVSLDNLLFFLLIAVAALFQLLSKTITKAGKSDSNETSSSPKPQTPRPIQRAPRESDTDRIRRFLEALGQPPSSTPPPPVLPRTDIPPRPLAPVQPPPVIPGMWRLPRERPEKPDVTHGESAPLERPSRLEQMVPPPVPPPATPVFEIQEAQLPVQPPPIIKTPAVAYSPTTPSVAKGKDLKTDISTLLASASGLRDAMILREIFGPPRSLQPLENLSGPA